MYGRQPGAVEAQGGNWNVSQAGWAATWQRRVVALLPRLTGTLEQLVAARIARVDPSGALELDLSVAESASGGTAIVTLPLRILCPTCGGVASPRGVWCRRCEYEGQVTEAVPVRIPIPPIAREGHTFSVAAGRPGAPAQRVRIRIPG